MNLKVVAIAALFSSIVSTTAQAAGYDATVELRDGTSRIARHTTATTAPSAMPRRVTLESSAENPFTVVWKVVRRDPTAAVDGLVHFYVVKMDRQGQAPPPLEPSRVVLESAVTMDFPPGETSGGTQQFRVDGPGIYLVRVEIGADPDKPGSEDFAELELVAK